MRLFHLLSLTTIDGILRHCRSGLSSRRTHGGSSSPSSPSTSLTPAAGVSEVLGEEGEDEPPCVLREERPERQWRRMPSIVVNDNKWNSRMSDLFYSQRSSAPERLSSTPVRTRRTDHHRATSKIRGYERDQREAMTEASTELSEELDIPTLSHPVSYTHLTLPTKRI